MYLEIVLIILIQGTQCFSESVFVAKVLENGYVYTDMKPLQRIIKPPLKFDEDDGITFCFWLYPYRFYKSNSIMSVKTSLKDSSEISFKLMNGSFVIIVSRCYFKLGLTPQIREWTHYCQIFSDTVDIYVNGNFHSGHSCHNKLLLQDVQEFNITIGRSSRVRTPYSGMIADHRLYFSKLKEDEIKKVAQTIETKTRYIDILNTTSFGMTFVDIDIMESTELTKSYMPYVLLYSDDQKYYKDAKQVCENRGGLLPDIDIHEEEVIIELIHTFEMKTGKRFETFWLNRQNSSCLTGLILSKTLHIIVSQKLCNNSRKSFVCFVEKIKSYKLIGFHENDNVFYPVPNEIGVFESFSKFRLYLHNGAFSLIDVSENFLWYESESVTLDTLIGRYYWHRVDGTESKIEMTFTGCDDKEFTCSDGTCTDFKNLCGFVGECSDFSDETFSLCEAGYPPSSSYDKRLPPSSSTNNATKVKIEMELTRISNISAGENVMTLFFTYVFSWKDERLEFKFLKPNESIDVANVFADMYWRPDVIVKEAVKGEEMKLSCKKNPGKLSAIPLEEGYLKVINSSNVLNFEGDVVDISCENSLPLTINCQIDLFFYPFDVQDCSITLNLINDHIEDIKWDAIKSNITINPSVALAIYEITSFSSSFTRDRELKMQLQLSRKYGSVVVSTIMPCVIVEIILILTHLIPPSDSYNRVVGTALAETVVANLFSSLNKMLPESDDPRMIDIWLFVHVLISLQVFINHLIVIQAYEREVERDFLGVWRYGIFFMKTEQKPKKKEETKRGKTSSNRRNKTCSIFNKSAKTLNRNLLIFSVVTYSLFLLFYFLAVRRLIDVLIGF